MPRIGTIVLLLCVLLLSGCRRDEPATAVSHHTYAPIALHSLPPTPTPKPDPLTVAVDMAVPPPFRFAAQTLAADPARAVALTDANADVRLAVGGGVPLGEWVYAVAAPFATVADEVPLPEVQGAWQQGNAPWSLVVDTETAVIFSSFWGPPHPDVTLVSPLLLVNEVWARPAALTLLPFHRLAPELKVLQVDGQSPLQKDFAADAYPLTVPVGVVGEETAVAGFLRLWPGPVTNRDPARLTTVAMTGVTALVRATAWQMEVNGVQYPGTAVAPLLQAADIAHVSNEVAFAVDCPYPDPAGGTTFCSRDDYFALLEELGVDVVELTGNHVNDWGQESVRHTLDLYEAAGMQTFGGGRDAAAAAAPLRLTHNGNRIAFVGCNPVGPAYAWATAAGAGSRPCTDEFYTQIAELEAQGYLVIATLQYQEYYHYLPTAVQERDFARAAAAGATAVSGSQGHHAQAFAFHEGRFIHYGLGNLFFDQMNQLGTRQTLIDTYVIYEGRLLSVTVWTGLIENWARPRPMNDAERRQVLITLFQASGWHVNESR